MFNGIVEEIGIVDALERRKNLSALKVRARKVLQGTKPGDSIAVEGVCLTVTEKKKNILAFDMMRETVSKTSLGQRRSGASPVTCWTAACTASHVTASGSAVVVTCDALTDTSRFSVNTAIDPGSDATFVLQADVANGKISNSSTSTLQVSLQAFSDRTQTAFSNATSHVAWSDVDNAALTSASVFRWIEYPETSVNGTSYNG